ncbi:MAG: hypothetical protein V1897_15910, partial [Pseudomonadota bacterium]
MKLDRHDQTTFISSGSEPKDYFCQGCRYWINGIGNWGNCCVVKPEDGEMPGCHIHKHSSCKFWKWATETFALESDILENRATKDEALYGAMFKKPACPSGFSCTTCSRLVNDVACELFEGEITIGSCCDQWRPNTYAVKEISEYADQTNPTSEDEAQKLASVYGEEIGSE